MINAYLNLLRHWQRKMALVSEDDLPYLQERHVADSQQLCPYVPENCTLADIGSGNGFPGILIAIEKQIPVTFYEVNQKKAAFLRCVQAELGLPGAVKAMDVSRETSPYQVITARAFASLQKLLALTKNMRFPDTRYILLKGKTWDEEIEIALRTYFFSFAIHPSKSENTGAILEVWNVNEKNRNC